MPRQKNDGKGRIGGRAKGTPNKVSGSVKEWISDLIDKNRSKIEKDLKALTPKDRLTMLEKLMQYVVPKQEALTANVDVSRLSDDQLDDIVERIASGFVYNEKGDCLNED